MAEEIVYANAHLGGTFTNPDNALGNTPSTWAGDLNAVNSYSSDYQLANTADPLAPLQTNTIRIFARKGTNNGTPTISIDLLDNGVLVGTILGDTNITSTVNQTLTATFLSTQVPSGVVGVRVNQTGTGGNASTRNCAQISHIELTAITEAQAESFSGTGSITGGGLASASGTKVEYETHSGTGSITGGGSTSASGTKTEYETHSGTGLVSGGGVTSASGTKAEYETRSGTGSITGGGSLTSSGVANRIGLGLVSGGGGIEPQGTSSRFGSALVSGGGSATLTGTRSEFGSGTGFGQISGGGVSSSSGTAHRFGSGVVTGGGGLSPSGVVAKSGAVLVTGGGNQNGSGYVGYIGVGSISGGGDVTGIGTASRVGSALVTGGGRATGGRFVVAKEFTASIGFANAWVLNARPTRVSTLVASAKKVVVLEDTKPHRKLTTPLPAQRSLTTTLPARR